MIRNTMLALSFLALSATSSFAATKAVVTHHSTRTVAEGEAAPADKTAPAKKEKKAKKEKAPKAEKDAAPKGDMKAPEAK